MRTMLYKFVSLLVIFSMALNAISFQTTAAQAASPAENITTGQAASAGVSPNAGMAQKAAFASAPTPAAPPVATPQPIVVTQIPVGGGTLRSLNGSFSIVFGAAFGKSFTATLQTVGTGNAPTRGMHSVGLGYSFHATLLNGVEINSFAPQPPPTKDSDANAANNFTITVKYTDADIWELDEATIGVYAREPVTGKWRRLPSLLNTAVHSVTAQADQPGDFAVFAERQIKVAAQSVAAAKNMKLVLDPDDNVGHALWNGTTYTELPFNAQLARQVRDKLATDGCSVDVLLTRETANPDYLNPSNRAQQATNFGADMFVTLAFNALIGTPWGLSNNGGVETWARNGHSDDDALADQFRNQITTYTGRPHNKSIQHPAMYSAFDALPASMTYAHIENLYLDHNYDWPVIHDHFDYITNAAYAAIRTQLEAKGMVCKSGNPLPKPPSAEELQHLRDLGYQNYLQYGADPVSFSTGNHVVKRDLFTLPEQGNTTFNFSLVYNSQDDREGYFGFGWSAPIAYIQRYSDESATLTFADGRTYDFGPDYKTPEDLHGTLARTDDGWKWTNADGSAMTFTEALLGYSPVTTITDRRGNTYQYEYDFQGQAQGNPRPQLLKITDTAGQVISFHSDSDGHITSMALPGNRAYQFEYTNSDLTKITDPNGGAYRYEYDNLDRVVKQWDPAGYLFLQNQYDDKSRVVKQIDASGTTLTLVYGSGVTTFTDNLGHVTQYFYDSQNRVTSIKDALGFTTSATYDAQDNVLQRTDKRGNAFTFIYDTTSHPLTASGPEGYSASYTYNQFGDLTSVTDNGGANGAARATSFDVNDKGEVEAIHYADGTSVQMTYDSKGNLKTSKDEKSAITSYTYDGQGNLIEIANPLGAKTSFTYDAARRKTSMTDANGNLVKFSYDANSNITKITDPKGNDTAFFYDKNDDLVKMVDRRGGVSLFTYDDDLKLSTESDPEGNVTRYAYDAAYNLIGVTDPRGNVTRYVYNARYEVGQIQAANGGLTKFVYDQNGNVTQKTDALNQVTRYEYNGLNLLTAQVDPLNGRTSIGYDAVGRMVEQTNPRGAKTTFAHDLRDRIIEIRDALHGDWKINYDAAGNPVQYTDANGHSTGLQYDAANRLIAYTDAGNQTTHFEMDGVGNLKKVTDALGRITAYNYDANDNVSAVIDALGGATGFAYDAEDHLVAAKDARGNYTRFAYDLNGQMAQMTEAGGQISKFAYDGSRNLTKFTNAKGNSWTFGYNALNQRASETDPLNQSTQYHYDLLGRMVGATDAKGIETRYDYDALSRLTAVVQNNSSRPADNQTNVTTRYTYDAAGNLASTTDANGNVTTYTYDLLNHVTQEQNALGNTWRYAYDAAGNLTQRIDGNGDKTGYSYTVTDLLEKVSYPDHSFAQYAYDAVGNQTSAATSQLGAIINQYDALNRLTSSTDSAHRKIGYTYDATGNQASITYPDGKTVRYAYDATNYLAQVTDPSTGSGQAPQGKITKFTRDETHNATLVENPNQTLAKYEFDKAEQLKSVTNLGKNGKLINSFVYQLDEVGNRVQTTATYSYDNSKSELGRKAPQLVTQYAYDPLSRLTGSSDSLGRQSFYSYDAVGNRTKLTTNFDPFPSDNFAASVGHKPDGQTLNYSYDAINALTKITQGDGSRDLSQVTAQLNAFINEVKAQSGKQVEAGAADALIQAAAAILTQIQSGAPDQRTLAAAIDALSQQVQTARNRGQIKDDGIARSLQAKLREAGEANRRSQPKTTKEIDFKYDGNGNRTEQRLVQWDGRDALAPDHGNHDPSIQYQYDFENRLVSVRGSFDKLDNAALMGIDCLPTPNIDVAMTYDAYGRLFQRSTKPGADPKNATALDHDNGRETTQFVYDGLDPIATYSGGGWRNSDVDAEHNNGSKHTNYYRADGRILSMLSNLGADPHGGDALPECDPVHTQYFHYDGLNSVTALTDQKGQRVESYQYGDFGAISSKPASADLKNAYTYTGQEWDATTGLYHFYAREYDPATGTWLQQDAYRGDLAVPASLNRYGYVGNNPINFLDYLGYLTAVFVQGIDGGDNGEYFTHPDQGKKYGKQSDDYWKKTQVYESAGKSGIYKQLKIFDYAGKNPNTADVDYEARKLFEMINSLDDNEFVLYSHSKGSNVVNWMLANYPVNPPVCSRTAKKITIWNDYEGATGWAQVALLNKTHGLNLRYAEPDMAKLDIQHNVYRTLSDPTVWGDCKSDKNTNCIQRDIPCNLGDSHNIDDASCHLIDSVENKAQEVKRSITSTIDSAIGGVVNNIFRKITPPKPAPLFIP
ncbi:MAG: RHS repeat-associated core domain-containing protein, partial [Anaerolineales bacterium]